MAAHDYRKRKYRICQKCGYEKFDQYDYDRWQEKHQAEEQGKSALRDYLKYHQSLEESRGVGQERFLCASCGKVLPPKEHNVTYPAIPLCTDCVCKLRKYDGHLVFEHIDGYTTTRYCIRCWDYEEWQDAERQTTLLSKRPCGGAAFTGTLEELMKE